MTARSVYHKQMIFAVIIMFILVCVYGSSLGGLSRHSSTTAPSTATAAATTATATGGRV